MKGAFIAAVMLAVYCQSALGIEPTSARRIPTATPGRVPPMSTARTAMRWRQPPARSPSDEVFVPTLPEDSSDEQSPEPADENSNSSHRVAPSGSGAIGREIGCCDTCHACGEGECGKECGCSSCGKTCAHCGGSCKANRGGCGCGCCVEPQPWRLFNYCGPMSDVGISLRGWLDQSYTFNAESPSTRFNGPMTFNDRDEWLGNQAYAVLEKPLDTTCGWDIGGRVDVLYGSDFRFTQARGLETRRDNSVRWNSELFYGLALPQLYAEVGAGNLSVKMGHFYTIIGYETVTAPDTFFLSRSYAKQYGEPFTHTGLLASYALNNAWTVSSGFHRGWDNWEGDDLDRISYLGGLSWQGADASSLAFAITHGQQDVTNVGDGFEVASTITMYSVVYKRPLWNGICYVLQHDHGWADIENGQFTESDWYGINQYWIKRINACWSAALRFEWFRDDDGVRVAAPGNNNADRFGARNPASSGGFTGNFFELTAGLNYSPCPNLIVRHAIRWDWFERDNDSVPLPYDDGNSDDQLTLSVDAIVLF